MYSNEPGEQIIMLKKGELPSIALVFMLINVVGATAVEYLPAVASKFAKQDAWMTAVIATIPGIAVILIVTELGRRFPGKTIIEYLHDILGNWLGKTIGFLYLLFFIHTNGVVIREFSELLAGIIMPHTPIIVFHVVFVLLAAYAVRSGLEVISRLIVITIPWVLAIYGVIIIIGFLKGEFNHLLPMLENGFKPILLGSLTPSAWRGEVVILAMYLPYLSEPRMGRTLGVWSVIFLGLLLTFNAIANTMVFGPETPRLVFPTFIVTHQVLNRGFFDVVSIVVWLLGAFAKITQFYYVAVLGTAQLLSLKDYRSVTLSIGVILTALSILAIENSVAISAYITSGFPPFAYLFEWVIPLVLLLIAIARHFKVKY